MKDNDKLEDAARAAIVEIAVQNNLYFVFWSGHFGRYFVALENKSKKNPDIYAAIYDHYYDVVGNDKEAFRFNIPQKTTWQEVLPLVKVNVQTDSLKAHINEKHIGGITALLKKCLKTSRR